MEMLVIQLDKSTDTPLYEQIYDQIQMDISDGKLPVGMKLPSKRKLGEFLAVSQTTIELAYAQLVAEGFISSKPKKGFYVQAIEELAYVQPVEIKNKSVNQVDEDVAIDFAPGKIDTESFPFTHWRKCAKDIMDNSSQHLLLLGHPHGDFELRQEIARYLYHSRGVDCTPEQIIVGSGTEQLMPLVIRILGTDAKYAIEDPGYPLTHHVFYHNNREVFPIAVDDEGMDVQSLQRSGATVAYVTPSHQFPTGTVLSAARRTALLNWASSQDEHFIIEDDYDSEFRYTGRPIPSLQGMDKGGNVIYLSTFSKSLMPSLRIAYMVLPPVLLDRYEKAFIHYSSTVPRLDQHILARFMADGHFSRHLNRMRKIYKHKLLILTEALLSYAPDISFSGDEAGMHINVNVHTDVCEELLTEAARKAGIRVYGLNGYRTTPIDSDPSFLIGFGGLSVDEISKLIDKLMKTWDIQKDDGSM
ncbi:PLP-dependent aminotransferase family protein [Sporosarcina limicola]|uniref:GntR family transcriptional regulator/MocR family aminotransferase n=1 Tax=Sporosarcina limicola TaxID=34101 RepID=A0A927R5B2_9BACL|nr:PLP-dependent aminotransferase family protein [Sporosarcina limicola]MBE1557161.1 GntR family transcriptional regulator/MocR family aminotransferase [Sporosarcina limicola]